MVERAPKYETRKTIYDLAKEVSMELKHTHGNFNKAIKIVLDREGVTNDFQERLKFKSAIGKILGEHSASLKTKKHKEKTVTVEQKPVDFLKEANIRRIKKMQERTPLFGEQIAEEEGLDKLK